MACYLVEWYLPLHLDDTLDRIAADLDDHAAASSDEGTMRVKLLTMLAVPADEVLFGIFAAASAQVVARTCRRAGIPAQRVSDVRVSQTRHRETPDDSVNPRQ